MIDWICDFLIILTFRIEFIGVRKDNQISRDISGKTNFEQMVNDTIHHYKVKDKKTYDYRNT